jgi:SIR2-like domain
MERVAFLIGAGASVAAGLPSTGDLTATVLAGDVHRGSNSSYYPGTHPNPAAVPPEPDYIAAVRAQVSELKGEVDAFYSGYPFRVANYEDIYYLAAQVSDALSGEYDNPGLRLLLERLQPIALRYFASGRPHQTSEAILLEATNEVVRYVEDVVWRSLMVNTDAAKCVDLLSDAASDESLLTCDIYTLNHDVLIESTLESRGIAFTDGFGRPQGSVRAWDAQLLEQPAEGVLLAKLHGSVSWCGYSGFGLCVTLDGDMDHVTNSDGTIERDACGNGRPTMLCGTFNKMLQYLRGPYLDLHLLLRRRLASTNRLVITGYGFGDKGVNSRLWDWMSSDENTMVLVHKEAERVRDDSRGAIRRAWPEWENAGRLRIVEKWAEDANWDDVRALLA